LERLVDPLEYNLHRIQRIFINISAWPHHFLPVTKQSTGSGWQARGVGKSNRVLSVSTDVKRGSPFAAVRSHMKLMT